MKFSIALIASVAVGATALPNIAPAQHRDARAIAPAQEKRGILNWLGVRQGPDGQEGQDGDFGGQQSQSAGPRPTGDFGGQESRSGGYRPTGGFGGQHSHSAGARPTGGRGSGRGGFGGQQSQSFGAQPTGFPGGDDEGNGEGNSEGFPGAGQQSESFGPRPTGGFGGQHSHSAGARPTGSGGHGGFGQESGSLGPRPTGDFGQHSQSAGVAPTGSFVPPTQTEAPVVEAAADSDSGSLPASSGTSTLAAAQTIAAGDSFDGGMYMIDRGASCTGQDEGGDSDAVFILEDGASLSNVIIGPNQIEGVHCRGACTLTNVWWSAVCEDAFTIKLQDDGETTTITGGGAFGADDKVLQHNGGGTLSVSDFYVEDFGKLYRSCGNCDSMPERHVIMDSITAVSGKVLAGINSNMGDTATLTNIVASDVDDICVRYEGVTDGSEPSKLGSGPDSEACLYSESDVTSS